MRYWPRCKMLLGSCWTPPLLQLMSRRLLPLLLLACIVQQASWAAVIETPIIDAQDCKVLLEWKSYARINGTPKSCTNMQCGMFPGITCGGVGRVRNLVLNAEAAGALPDSLSVLSELVELDITDRVMQRTFGTLPSSWANLTKLQTLRLYAGTVGGTLPAIWSKLKDLKTLVLSHNKITGTLPPEFSELQNLVEFDVYDNEITGTLPPSWGKLKKLKRVEMPFNDLRGTIPANWSGMTDLAYIGLGYNERLEGTIPESLGLLKSMYDVSLEKTYLSGTLPKAWQQPEFPTFLNVLSTKMCGPRTPTPTCPKEPPAPLESLPDPSTPRPTSQPPSTSGGDPVLQGGKPGSAGLSPAVTDPSKQLGQPRSASGGGKKKKQTSLFIGVGVAIALALLGILVAVVVVWRRNRGLAGLHPKVPLGLETAVVHASKDTSTLGGDGSNHGADRRQLVHKDVGASTANEGPTHDARGAAAGGAHVAGGVGAAAAGRPAAAAATPAMAARTEHGKPPDDRNTAKTSRSMPSSWNSTAQPVVATAAPASTAAAPSAATTTQEPGVRAAANSTSSPPYRPGPPVAGGNINPAPVMMLTMGRSGPATPGGAGGSSDLSATVAKDVAIMLPLCVQLGLKIVEASERVVANNARCSLLVARISAMQPLLQQLEESTARQTGFMRSSEHRALEPVLQNIYKVFLDVHDCIVAWCQPSRLGAVITVLRNMTTASWFQEGFVELNMRLSGAFTDLCTAMQIRDWSTRNPDRAAVEAETKQQTEADLRGLVVDLATVGEDGRDSWEKLEPEDKNKIATIFDHHQLDLTATVKQARQEALEKATNRMLIPMKDVTKLRLIGKGGYGEVFAGTWKRTQVALKWLETGPMSQRDRADVLREAFIHQRAHNHPNVCLLYGVVLEDAACVLVMELGTGDLHQLMADGDVVLTTARKYELALDVAQGMEHLHSKGIVHGDLKPSNVLLRSSGTLAVADFGLSSITCLSLSASISAARGRLTSESTALTVCYSPPELLAARTTSKTAAGDVYSFGMLLLEVFTGQRPFGNMPVEAILRHVLGGGRPEVPARVPAGCAALIGDCLEQDPARRPAFTEVCDALERLLGELRGS